MKKIKNVLSLCESWPASKVEMRPISEIIPYKKNPRTHTQEQIKLIATSMKDDGVIAPILLDENGVIIYGHGRLAAAIENGFEKYPVCIARGWTEEKKQSVRIKDNSLSLLSGWDNALLQVEISDLQTSGYPIHLLGFADHQLVKFGVSLDQAGATDPDAVVEPPKKPVSRLGDVWVMGDHRLMCGDSKSIAAVRLLLDKTIPDIANCDPPYGVDIVKTKRPYGGKKQFGADKKKSGQVHGTLAKEMIACGVYAPIIGDDSVETAVCTHEVLTEIGVKVMVLWGGNYYANRIPASRCWFVWDKQVTGSFADCELAWTNCDQVARIFHHQWNGLMKASERREKRVHPTQKPVALAEWVIETAAPEAKTYLDLFMGSGSSLIACERKGLSCFGMEMAESYVDAAILRWQAFTGLEARLGGRTFAQVARERAKGRPVRTPSSGSRRRVAPSAA